MSADRGSSLRAGAPTRPREAPPSRNRALAARAGLILLALGLSLGAFLSAPRQAGTEGSWKGYCTILAEASLPESELLAALAASGFKTVISASTEPVLVSNWDELEILPLGAALERLVKGDPRRDPYIESLGSWFSATVEGKPYRAYYVPAPLAMLPERALAKALEPFRGRYVLPDAALPSSPKASAPAGLSFPGLAAAFVLVAAASLLGLGSSPRTARIRAQPRLAARLALGAPWIAAAAAGLPMAAIASLWGIALVELADRLDLPLDEYARSGSLSSAIDSLARQAKPPLALLLSALASLALAPRALPSAGLALLGSAAALASWADLNRMARASAPRPRFVPKPIAAPRRSRAWASPWLACLACLAVGLWPLGRLGAGRVSASAPGSISYPRPIAVEGSQRPGLEEARRRARAAGSGRLPDLASWLEHRALQEALPLERVGENRPDPFEPVAVSRPGGEALSLRFDEDWARSAYRSIPPASVEGMLAAQGASVAAFTGAAAGEGAGGGKGRPLAPIEALRYILLLIPPLGRIAAGLRASRGSPTSETRQEA